MLLILKVHPNLKDKSVLLQFAFTKQNPRLYIIEVSLHTCVTQFLLAKKDKLTIRNRHLGKELTN